MKRSLETYFLNTLFVSPKVNTDLLWSFTIIFVILCALYFGFIFFFRNKFSKKSKAVEKRKKELTPMIVEFLFYDENSQKQEETDYVNLKVEIRELINNSFNRKVLIDILMYLRKDLSGTTLSKLFRLYQELGLHHDSYKKLDSWRWQNISKGIIELTQMNVEDSYVFITKFINDKRTTIRKQAEVAIITLKAEGLNYFLDTTTYRISEWQQLKILEVLINKKNYLPPSFNHWLMSKNNNVVLFALRLMKNYNQNDGNKALIELLKHKNSDIKMAAMSCIKEFHVVEALDNLKLVFWNSKIDVRIGILDVISSVGDKNEIAFLESVVAKESNFNVKSKSLACINVIEPMSVLPTIDIQASEIFTIPNNLPVDSVGESLKSSTNSTTITEEASIVVQSKEPEETKAKYITEFKDIIPVELDVSTELDLSVIPNEEQNDRIKSEENSSETYLDQSPTLDEFNLGFLPLIIPQEKVRIAKYNPNEKIEISNLISEIEVVCHEVGLASNKRTSNHKIIKFNNSENKLSEIIADFIPLVLPIKEKVIIDSEIKVPIHLLDLTVIYSEILTNHIEENKIVHQEDKLEWKKKSKVEISSKTNSNQSSLTINNIDMKEIRKIECDVNEIQINEQDLKPLSSLNDSEIYQDVSTEGPNAKIALEWVLSENEARSEMKQKLKTILNHQDSIPFNIPKPIFYNESQANTMELLDDIEAFGDSREIPLLNDLLRNQTEITIYKRIEYLIVKLKNTEVLKRQPIEQDNEVISVFEKYFLGLDIQSKLILLNEIVAVGDEKEIPFLRRLITDDAEKVSEKAEKCLGELLLKLNNLKQVTEVIDKPKVEPEVLEIKRDFIVDKTKPAEEVIEKIIKKPFNVFDIDFDIELEDLKDTK